VKGSCKLCGAVIETDPDPLMDEDHEKRERTAFFNRVAFHIDARNKRCTVNDKKLAINRYLMMTQDNGWFQRWRLLACLNDLDAYSLAKEEEWRSYLHTITSGEASRRAPEPEPPPKVEPKPETVQ
jgi:hypothetical protein